MASKLYLMTHGETALDREGRLHGWKVDAPLSTQGRLTVKSAASKLADKGISKIYHSPLKRSVETAQILAKATGVPAEARDELLPWNVGSLSGAKVNSIRPLLDFFSNHPERKVPDGESKNEFLGRYSGFMKSLKGSKQSVAIAGHSQHSLGLAYAQGKGDATQVPVVGGKPGQIDEVNL